VVSGACAWIGPVKPAWWPRDERVPDQANTELTRLASPSLYDLSLNRE